MRKLTLFVLLSAMSACVGGGCSDTLGCRNACYPNPVEYVSADRCQCHFSEDAGK